MPGVLVDHPEESLRERLADSFLWIDSITHSLARQPVGGVRVRTPTRVVRDRYSAPGSSMVRYVDQSNRTIQLPRWGLNRSTTPSTSTHISPSSSNRIIPRPWLSSSCCSLMLFRLAPARPRSNSGRWPSEKGPDVRPARRVWRRMFNHLTTSRCSAGRTSARALIGLGAAFGVAEHESSSCNEQEGD